MGTSPLVPLIVASQIRIVPSRQGAGQALAVRAESDTMDPGGLLAPELFASPETRFARLRRRSTDVHPTAVARYSVSRAASMSVGTLWYRRQTIQKPMAAHSKRSRVSSNPWPSREGVGTAVSPAPVSIGLVPDSGAPNGVAAG